VFILHIVPVPISKHNIDVVRSLKLNKNGTSPQKRKMPNAVTDSYPHSDASLLISNLRWLWKIEQDVKPDGSN
jgi:hypothetical protein